MSKEKPEVGDVWKDTFFEYYILYSDDTTTECCFINGNRKARVANFLTNRIIRDWKYFGKSKANINDLFEVKQ
jgi:hypothetical protein